MTYYSVFDKQIKELRTDFAYYKDKARLKDEFEQHMIEVKEVKSNEDERIWNEFGYRIIETPLDFINESEKQILREVVHGYYANVNKGWFEDFNHIDKSEIKSIVEFKEFGFAGAWYVVFTHTDKPLVIKHNVNDVNTYFIMYEYIWGFKLQVYEMSYKAVY